MAERVYIDVEPHAARQTLAAMACAVPRTPEEHGEWAATAEHAAWVAGAPRWVRDAWDEARQWCGAHGRCGSPAVDACLKSAAWLAGYSKRAVEKVLFPGGQRFEVGDECGWEIGEAIPARPEPEKFCWACEEKGCSAACGKREFVRRDFDPKWWDELTAKRDGCRSCLLVVESVETGQQMGHVASCGTRACEGCARRAMARAVGRYVAVFAAPLRDTHLFEMFTMGSLASIADPVEYAAWRRRVRSLQRAMMRGAPECGIQPGTWCGGLVVCETTQEGPNGLRGHGVSYAHAHVLAIRRKRYPYGLAHERLVEAWDAIGYQHRYTRAGRVRKAAIYAIDGWLRARRRCQECGRVGCSVGCRANPEAWLGLRELQRRVGLGEVGQHDILKQDLQSGKGGIPVAAKYLMKVNAYLSKVSSQGATARMYTDPQVQWMLRGTRRCDPFGCLRGWHAGPTETGAERAPGVRDDRKMVGLYQDRLEAEAAGARPEVDDWPRYVWHRINEESLEAWKEWADVDAYRKAFIEPRSRPVPHPVVAPWRRVSIAARSRWSEWLRVRMAAIDARPVPSPPPRLPKPRRVSGETRHDFQPSLFGRGLTKTLDVARRARNHIRECASGPSMKNRRKASTPEMIRTSGLPIRKELDQSKTGNPPGPPEVDQC